MTLAIISVAGMYTGVNMSKFSSFFSRAFLALLRDLEDKLFNNPACFLHRSLSNFCFCLSLVTCWVFVLNSVLVS